MVCKDGRTKPGLWKSVVASVKASSKGGTSGKWSARKAQLAGKKYREKGGGYCGSKTKSQKSMKKWTKEKWGRINKDNPNSRYLPKKVRNSLSVGEKRAASRGKRLGSRKKYTGAVKRKMSSRGGVRKAKTRIRKGRK